MAWDEEARRFLKHLQAEGRSPKYIGNARGILRRFGETTGGRGFEKVSKDDVEGWLADLRGQGISHSTVSGYFAMVKAAIRYLNEGENPPCLRGLKAGAKDSRVKTKGELLTEKEYRRLLNVMPPGKALIYRLLWDTGARPGEIVRLRREHLSFGHAQGREFVELSFPDTKNGTPRVVPVVNGETLAALKAHLEIVPENGFLFPSPINAGESLRSEALWHYLGRAAKQAGIKKRVYPYLFRHTAATRRYNAPAGVRDRMMGWKSDMAKNYEHLDTENVRDYLLETEGPASSDMTPEETMERAMAAVLELSKDPARLRAFLERVRA
jgi:integrase/recombinase XerD